MPEVVTSKFPKKKDNKYDLNKENITYVILGTGLTESIVGASLSMRGKKCLYLDKADRYGSTISNLNLEQFLKLVKSKMNDAETKYKPSDAAFHSFRVLRPLDKNKHPRQITNAGDYKRFSRNFNIDLAPKILFSKSISVEHLISSQVAKYLEFNNVNENFFYSPSGDGELANSMVKIPFSKSDIFTSTVLSFKEKRQLVKTIEMCLMGTDLEEKRIEEEK